MPPGHAGVSGAAGGFDPTIFADFSDILGDFFGFGDVFGGVKFNILSEYAQAPVALLLGALLGWIYHSYYADPPSWLPLQATFLYSGVAILVFIASTAVTVRAPISW